METLNTNALSNSTTQIKPWNNPELVNVIENSDNIEFIYKETSITKSYFTTELTQERVFKIVFSCVDGKWNKSNRIYGTINPSQTEYYTF